MDPGPSPADRGVQLRIGRVVRVQDIEELQQCLWLLGETPERLIGPISLD